MRHSIGGALRNRSHRSSSASASEEPRDTAEGEDTEVVEPEQGNVLSHIISQLRPGADLSRVTLPTFILEPRSMLERITNFMAHPDTLLPMPKVEDPVERFVAVVKFYLSGWHIRPPGVKKPLNPILGETFTCYWDYPDGTRGYYIAEQTSHHPPKSSYFFMAPYHHIRVDGTLKPRSKFLGNSAASMMEGISYLRFTNRGKSKGGEKYILTQPNMYARGILFGKMKYELGDHSYVRCPENNLSADIEFKTKGWMGGTYNAIGGAIKNDQTGEVLYELSGLWSGEMYIKDVKTGQKKTLFDATHAKHAPPRTRPLEEQGDRESQKLWYNTVKAVKAADHEKATMEKAKIEDQQREEAKRREELGVEWQPQLFRRVDAKKGGSEEGEEDLEWIIHAHLDSKDPKELEQKILSIAPILPGQGKPGGPEHRPHQHAPAKEAAQPPAEASAKQGVAGANNPPTDKTTQQQAPQQATPQQAHPKQAQPKQAAPPESKPTSNLIDFDSKPAPSNPPAPSHPTQPKEPVVAPAARAGQPMQPTSNQQGVAPVYEAITVNPPTEHSSKSANLMDDDNDVSHMNSQMTNLKMHQAMVPEGQAPLKRADTESSEVDVFVDAES